MKILYGKLNKLFLKQYKKIRNSENYIFYKIIDITHDEIFHIQCINTKAIIKTSIFELIIDKDLLYGLHPGQSSFVGIKYAEKIKSSKEFEKNAYPKNLYQYEESRYGRFIIESQSRNKDITFFECDTKQRHTMEPRDIALCEVLISEFDAIHAFYIGLNAGLKMFIPVKSREKPRLKLVS